MKQGQRLPADAQERSRVEQFDKELLAFQQSAEWGMCSLQDSFGRLRVPLKINDAEQRGDLLEICVRLQNLRTELVGINQLCSVYLPIWKANEQEEIWDHFENILFGDQHKHDRVSKFHLIYN